MEMVHGAAAIEGKVVMHLCDNPACFLYEHLRIGTQRENLADRDSKGRQPAPPRGAANGNAKLTAASVAEIRERHALGQSPRTLGLAYGVSPSTISRIIQGTRWAGV